MSCAWSTAPSAASTWLLADRSRAWSLSRSDRSGCQIVQAQSSVHTIASAAKTGRSERVTNRGRRGRSGGGGGGGGNPARRHPAVGASGGGGPEAAATATGAGAATGGGGGGGGGAAGAGPCPLVAA